MTRQPEPPAPVSAAPNPAEPREIHTNLSGATAGELMQLLGPPALQVREGPGLKLQFRGRACILAPAGATMREGRPGLLGKVRGMQRRISGLQDHFIVCAYGRVGRAVVRELEAEGAPFVVIDSKESLEGLMRSDGVPYIIDDPSKEGVLRMAGIEGLRGAPPSVLKEAMLALGLIETATARPPSFPLNAEARAQTRHFVETLRALLADEPGAL